jgi:hypothetical protein
MRVPFSPASLPTFVVSVVLDVSYSNRSEVESKVVLICISFMVRAGEHLFMCFLAIWTSSFDKVLFSSVAQFFIGSLILREFRVFEHPVYSGYQSLV